MNRLTLAMPRKHYVRKTGDQPLILAAEIDKARAKLMRLARLGNRQAIDELWRTYRCTIVVGGRSA